ncbi:MAG: hypothetical protein KBF73_07355 [Flavobacteriales bacterium]|nr:hypothetical protein [Flavobacteriales bacterium]
MKITDPKRGGQDVARYMHELIAEVYSAANEKQLKKWLGTEKATLEVNATYASNRNVKSEDIFYPAYVPEGTLSKDSIQKLINRYESKNNSGLGFVVIFEYLSKERKSVSGYGCFFDLKTVVIVEVN